jgi:DNA helicase II / ATP-dependent DNA helicase PcrA
MQLNEEQQAAVEHPIGSPAVLIAGAGSGKTATLTARINWLISQGVEPRRILAITFTNKASEEMVHRLAIDPQTPRELCPKVSTIHSLALAAIRRNPKGFGLQEKVSLLDDYDQSQMMKRIVERHSSTVNPWGLLEHIDFHRARGVGFTPDYTKEVHEAAKKAYSGAHALTQDDVRLWTEFEREKTANSVVDFSDMIHLCVRRMKNDAGWGEAMSKLFHFVIQDEAQDTSKVQWEFVTGLLAKDNPNMYAVGDASQAIFGFAGSDPELLMEYSRGWRGISPTIYKLARNHRSVPQVVGLANATQRKMTFTIPLQMVSFRGLQGETGLTKLIKGATPADIASSIGYEIHRDAKLRHEEQILYRDNCVLVRSAMQVRDIENVLVRLRIPYVVRGGRGLMQTEEVRDVLSYLRAATNPNDFMAFCRSVAVPRRGAGDVLLEKIREVANKEFGGNLIEAAWKVNSTKLGGYVTTIREIQQNAANPVQALETVINKIRYKTYLQDKYKKEPDKVQDKMDNLDRLSTVISAMYEDSKLTTEDIVFQLSMNDQGKDQPNDSNGKVTISTIHASKGLEYRRVFITNVYTGSLPHKWSLGSGAEIEEERRVWYVACTRARDILVICVPATQPTHKGSHVQAEPSIFLRELGIV